MTPLRQRIDLDISQAKRKWREVKGEAAGYSQTSERAITGSNRKITQSTQRMSGMMKVAFASVVTFISTQLIGAMSRVVGKLFEMGTAAEETASKFRAVFRGASGEVDRFLNKFIQKTNLTITQARDFAAAFGGLFSGLGADVRKAGELSNRLVELAGDLASFNNTDIQQALNALRSGLVGEQEPLKRFNIVLREADVVTKALAMTGKQAAGDLTELERAIARLEIITERADVQVGDLDRTIDSTINRTRRLQGAMSRFVENLSTDALPVFAEWVEVLEGANEQQGGLLDGLRIGINLHVLRPLREAATLLKIMPNLMRAAFSTGGGRAAAIGRIGSQLGAFRDRSPDSRDTLGMGVFDSPDTLGMSVFDSPEGGPSDPAAFAKAQRTLQAIFEAQQIAAAGSDRERAALAEIFSIQEQIAQLKEAEKQLGSEAVREQLEFAEKRLEIARRELSRAEELRKKMKEAAEAFEGLVGRQGEGPLERAGFVPGGTRETSVEDLITDDGFISDKALRNAGMTAKEAKRIAEEMKKAQEAGDGLSEMFDGLAASIRSVTRLVDTFGDLSDEARRVADGVADVFDNMGRLRELRASGASFGAMLPGIVGAAAGVASTIAGIIGALKSDSEERRKQARRQVEEMKRLRDALEANRRAFERSTRALFEAPIVGAGFSASDIARARSIERSLQGSINTDSRGQVTGTQFNETRVRAMLQELEDMGFADGLIDMLEGFLAKDMNLGAALQAVLFETGLFGHINDLSENFGEFSNTVDGARAKLEFLQRFMGADLPTAFNAFIEHLLESVEGLDEDLVALLQEARGLDLSTDEGRARLKEIVAIIAANMPEFSGDLSLEELEAILEEMMEAAGGVDDGEFTRSQQFATAITEIQANEVIAILDEQLRMLRRILEAIRAESITLPAGGFPTGNVPLTRELDAAVSAVTLRAAPSVTTQSVGAPINNFGDFNFGGTLSESDIRSVLSAIEKELRRRNPRGRHGRLSL